MKNYNLITDYEYSICSSDSWLESFDSHNKVIDLPILIKKLNLNSLNEVKPEKELDMK